MQHFRDFEKLFWQLSRKMEYVWKDVYTQSFPGSQSHIMYLLQQSGPKKMSELAEALHLTAGAVTTASDHLIDHGYIARERDKKDRRVVYLHMNKKGTKTLEALKKEGRKKMKYVFQDISEEDLDRMITIFKQASFHIGNL